MKNSKINLLVIWLKMIKLNPLITINQFFHLVNLILNDIINHHSIIIFKIIIFNLF